MTDMIDRLRTLARWWPTASDGQPIASEAADEIERLRGGLKVSQAAVHSLAAKLDKRVLEVRPRDDVMPGAFIAKMKRPR